MSSSSTQPTDQTIKPPKLILQPFDGSNPIEWLFQAEQFFNHYSITPTQRLSRISCYMTGDALGWYQWMHNNHLISTWKEFTRAMELRFGPFAYENHQQALFKLQQTATVLEYQHDFERLCNRVTGLPHHSILDCFIFGLRPEIQNELAILQPVTISQAIGLAKLVESKLLASKPSFTYSPRPTQPKSILPLLPNPPPQPRLIQHPSFSLSN